ncbi:MAG TPA: RuBisCO large subunit C-terminal-like domain-containing protein [Verrucomicrobiae bacterium]|nr:RuBisCO large subunit C-terminal-like domain-containing protein [Verrucomicrobiae bacterium]
MKSPGAKALALLWHDGAKREECLRAIIGERLAARPAPILEDCIVATYFFAFRSQKLEQAVEEISYHATIGVKLPPAGSLLPERRINAAAGARASVARSDEPPLLATKTPSAPDSVGGSLRTGKSARRLLAACAARPAGTDAFDRTNRLGLVHVAFPLKMMLQPDGHLTSCDILHTVAAAIVFDVYENQDARLIGLQIPEKVIRTFPGPAHGPFGVRKLTGFGQDEPAFGTILKPTAGITAQDVGALVAQIATCRLFLFVKEDEDLYPNLDYCPVAERTRLAVAAIRKAGRQRGGLGLIFAPHISAAPHEILALAEAALEAGATGLMFSETFAGGTVRMIREAVKSRPNPPALYGHNAGIGIKTRGIWREVIDLLARLDGIDFRQTAPVRPGKPFLLPYGAEWTASEQTLTRPLPGIAPTMIVRAGALDQGNIGLNLADAERRGLTGQVLFLAGSAINSIKDKRGRPSPQLGAEAMLQALEVHRSGELRDVPMSKHLSALRGVAARKRLGALREALRQRYP